MKTLKGKNSCLHQVSRILVDSLGKGLLHMKEHMYVALHTTINHPYQRQPS